MIATIIIEDDPISADLLASTLKELKPDVEIRKVLGRVSDAVCYLKNHNDISLIFSDIQLSDGLSFCIFEQVQVSCPIIFISSYDKYMVNVFDYCGIDYLLKPVSHKEVNQAMAKYHSLQNHFNSAMPLRQVGDEFLRSRRNKLIVRKGSMLIALPLSEIVLFYTESMIVYAYSSNGQKYMVDKGLNQLETELETSQFMRVNRQYILNVAYVYGYKPYDRVKLVVCLKLKEIENMIIVGQEKTRAFKEWLMGG
ncbi:MAG: LytR/AlgR family response regulator transcription factor [Chitinophagaceae bacterium]